MPKTRTAWNKGKKLSEKHIENLRLSHIGLPKNKGAYTFKKGHKMSEAHIKNISLANKGKHNSLLTQFKEGHKGWNYIEDRSLLKKTDKKDTQAYRDWRKNVYQRDNWKCRIINNDCKGRIEAHHILGWTRYPELRYDINNGITLCHFHHPLKKKDEIELSPYFQKLVAETIKNDNRSN